MPGESPAAGTPAETGAAAAPAVAAPGSAAPANAPGTGIFRFMSFDNNFPAPPLLGVLLACSQRSVGARRSYVLCGDGPSSEVLTARGPPREVLTAKVLIRSVSNLGKQFSSFVFAFAYVPKATRCSRAGEAGRLRASKASRSKGQSGLRACEAQGSSHEEVLTKRSSMTGSSPRAEVLVGQASPESARRESLRHAHGAAWHEPKS